LRGLERSLNILLARAQPAIVFGGISAGSEWGWAEAEKKALWSQLGVLS
jgi:hypothetical protein